MTGNLRTYPVSQQLLAEAKLLIPATTQTFSKGPQVYGWDGVPHYLDHATGAVAVDVDGYEYIDWSMGLGSVILGHTDPRVCEAVTACLARGTSLSLMHPLELTVTRMVLDTMCPWAQMARFTRTGADAVSSATRLARACTGRDIVAIATGYPPGDSPAYHGWHDWCAAVGSMPKGIPQAVAELSATFQYDCVPSADAVFARYGDRVAAIVIDGGRYQPPSAAFVDWLNTVPHRHGALLIVDEVAAGLRLAPGGGHDLHALQPDLVAFGKSVANGLPFGVLAGGREVMDTLNEVSFTLTYGGELTALSAAHATLTAYRELDVLATMRRTGTLLREGLRDLVTELGLDAQVDVVGPATRFLVATRQPDRALVLRRELLAEGILTGGVHNLSFSHTTRHVEMTIHGYRKALSRVFDAR